MKNLSLLLTALVASVASAQGQEPRQQQDDLDIDDQSNQQQPPPSSGGDTPQLDEDAVSDTPEAIVPTNDPRIVVYYQSVYQGVGFDLADIAGDQMTHFVYSFLWMEKDEDTGIVTAIPGQQKIDTELIYNPETEECDCCAKGTYRQAFLLKKKYPHLRTMLSIGGWSQSDHFSDGVVDEEKRQALAASITKWMIDYEFDGIDIDWEYPTGGGEEGNSERPEDGQNLALFILELRRQWAPFEAQFNRRFELTVAVPASLPPYISGDSRVRDIFVDQVDFMLIMGYEYNWGSDVARHHANLFDSEGSPANLTRLSSDKAMKDFEGAGFNKNQLVLGVAAYCRTFTEVGAGDSNGLLQPGVTDGSILPYKEQGNLEDEGFEWFWDDAAKSGYYFNPDTGVFWSCEDPQSVQEKASYVDSNNYGGLMLWDIGNDLWEGDEDQSLLKAMADNLTNINFDNVVDRGDECPDGGEVNTFCNMGCAEDLEPLEKRIAVNDLNRPQVELEGNMSGVGNSDGGSGPGGNGPANNSVIEDGGVGRLFSTGAMVLVATVAGMMMAL